MGYICKTSAFSNNRKERVGLKILHVIIKFYVLMDCQTSVMCATTILAEKDTNSTSHVIEKIYSFSFSNSELQIT